MTAIAENMLFRYLGLNSQGDLGGWTFYTSKDKGLVFFPKSPPLKPPSYLQTVQRNKWRHAAQVWNAYTEQQRQDWMEAAIRAHLWIHGYDLFIYVITKPDRSILQTIERLSGIAIPPT
jgi:hypothetical protein